MDIAINKDDIYIVNKGLNINKFKLGFDTIKSYEIPIMNRNNYFGYTKEYIDLYFGEPMTFLYHRILDYNIYVEKSYMENNNYGGYGNLHRLIEAYSEYEVYNKYTDKLLEKCTGIEIKYFI